MQSEQHQDDGYGHLIPGGLTRKSVSVAKLPIIDFEPFLEGSASGKREVAQGLRNACVDVGFFYLANHGVPQPIIDRAFAQARTFFALPLAEKMEISQRKTPGYPGFTPMGLDVDDPKARKRQEGFNMNLELPHDALVDPASVSFHHPNLWPQRPEGFRADVEAYFKEMDRLKRQLYAAFALALDLPENFFEPELSRPFVNMRINHYAAQPVVEHHSDIGGRPHTDYCCFTILAQEDDVPGLQLVQTVSWRTLFLHVDQYRAQPPSVTAKSGKPLGRNPFTDARVRRAVSKAINRPAIAERVMENLRRFERFGSDPRGACDTGAYELDDQIGVDQRKHRAFVRAHGIDLQPAGIRVVYFRLNEL